MLPSTRFSIRISTLPALSVDLHEGKNAWIVCCDCNRWVEVSRGLVQVHRVDGVRCSGSRQHITFDLTPAQHERNRAAAQHAARKQRVRLYADAIEHALHHPPVPAAVHQIAARSTLAEGLRARDRFNAARPVRVPVAA